MVYTKVCQRFRGEATAADIGRPVDAAVHITKLDISTVWIVCKRFCSVVNSIYSIILARADDKKHVVVRGRRRSSETSDIW